MNEDTLGDPPKMCLLESHVERWLSPRPSPVALLAAAPKLESQN